MQLLLAASLVGLLGLAAGEAARPALAFMLVLALRPCSTRRALPFPVFGLLMLVSVLGAASAPKREGQDTRKSNFDKVRVSPAMKAETWRLLCALPAPAHRTAYSSLGMSLAGGIDQFEVDGNDIGEAAARQQSLHASRGRAQGYQAVRTHLGATTLA